jgi:magnesium chelatase family protein
VSGPIRDRLDLFVDLPRPTWREIWDLAAGEKSVAVRQRVLAARKRQEERHGDALWNALLSSRQVREEVILDGAGQKLLERATERMGLSVRGVDKVLRVARTIADLEGSDRVGPHHVGEAITYRVPANSA